MNLKKIFDSRKIADMAIVRKDGSGLKPRKFLDTWVGATFMGLNSYMFEPNSNDGFDNTESGDFVRVLSKSRTAEAYVAILVSENSDGDDIAKEVLRGDADSNNEKVTNAVDAFIKKYKGENVPTKVFKKGKRIK